MLPGSRSSNRSKPSLKYQPYQPEGYDIFNQSFYQEKLNSSQTYQSLQFLKRYMNETNLPFVVQKVMQIVLNLERLPHNPYNLMYRLIHHEAIYQNMKRHYNQGKERDNFINYNFQQEQYKANSSEQLDDKNQFMTLRLKEVQVYFNQQLAKYINPTNLFVFSKVVYSKKQKQRISSVCEKYNIAQIHMSLGGPIIMNLKGNGGVLEVPMKLPRQISEKSIYCAESMLNTTIYVQINRQLSKCFNDFVDFILDDILQSMQYKDQNYTIYFQRLQLINIDDVFSLVEFSRQQIISNVGIVQKQLLRSLSRQNLSLRSKNVYRLSKDLATVIGEQLITVTKEYVLVAQQHQILTMISNSPLQYMLKQIFLSSNIIDLITQHPQYTGRHLQLQFKKEMAYHMIYLLKMQKISYVAWQVFYYLIYEDNLTNQKKQFVQDLFHNISYILLSPMSFVEKLKHELRSVKWLTLPSFPTYSEQQVYTSIISLQREIIKFIQKGDYIYWELQIFYQAIQRLLSIIVQFKQLKLSSINFIVDHALLILEGITDNFNQILVVLQGNIVNYINLVKASLPPKQINRNLMFYQQYLKTKQLPNRVLRVDQEVKKIKKQLSMADSEVKSIIKAKYIARFGFYQKIYRFYWNLITGKKVMFPLSVFLKFLMMNSTQLSYEFFKDNYVRPKHKTERSIINQIPIYQVNHTETGTVFYSLNPEALKVYAFKDYKTVLQLLQPFFNEASKSDNDLGYRYGSKKSIQLDLNTTGKDQRIISIKSSIIGQSGIEESGSLSVAKMLVDVVSGRSFSSKGEFYNYVFQAVNTLMETLDRQNFSVLGLYSYHQNHYDSTSYEQHLYSKLLNQDNILRFDYKKKLNLQKLVKFIEFNINQGRLMEIRAIYNVREVTKLLKLSLNFYFKNALNQNNLYSSLFKMHYFNQRVFCSKKDLLSWCQLNTYKHIKELLVRQASSQMLNSMKRLHDEKEVSIIQILSQKELTQSKTNKKGPRNIVNKTKFYRQSPFYNILRKVGETVQVLLGVIQYLKVDRRGRFQMNHIRNLIQLIKYYLLQRCLIKDDYIYSEGLSVSMTNIQSLLEQYIECHPDNCGEERQLLQFQKIVRKLSDQVKFAQISCTICINQSLNLEQIKSAQNLNDSPKK